MSGISIPGISHKLEKIKFIFFGDASQLSQASSLKDKDTSDLGEISYVQPAPEKSYKLAQPVSFPLMFNPTNFSQNYSTVLAAKAESGKSVLEQEYKYSDPQEATFNLFFDATAVSVSSNSFEGGLIKNIKSQLNDGVDKLLNAFLKLALGFEKENHRPAFVYIVWGSYSFTGIVSKANVEYQLFSRSGKPLRAKVAVTVVSSVPDESRLRSTQNGNQGNSPDLTKIHKVIAGDTLPLIALKEYRDEGYYMELARVNGLRNYRKLEPGTLLVLPPIKKLEKRS